MYDEWAYHFPQTFIHSAKKESKTTSKKDEDVYTPEVKEQKTRDPPKGEDLRRVKSYETFCPTSKVDTSEPWEKETVDDSSGWVENINNPDQSYRISALLCVETCQQLISSAKQAIQSLQTLKSDYIQVREQTSSFQNSCETLMTVQKRYSELSDAIADRLKIFNSLDPTIRKLNNADITFVETDEFKEMLKSLDQSLEFLSTHKQFHDSEFYYSHFRQCMTRSLTLIRLYLTASLDIDTHEEPAEDMPFYTKYTVASYQLRPFAMEIEQRCQHQEYISLLKDCYAAYFSARQKFIAPMISKYIAGHVQEKHLVAFTRIILSYVRGILSDEFDLFFQFFDTGVEDLMTWFTYLLSPVYNHLRPRTIHQLDLSILCDLCILLQTQFIRDEEELITRVNEKVLDFGRLIRSVLQDAQTRVIFRTQQTIEKDIRKFMPTEPDLDYPAKLFERKQIQQDDEFDISHLLIGWYPTMRKSVWILSKIYRLVNSVVFDDLAHEITHVCTHSLISAAIRIAQLHSNTDSRLFLIHHLLLLKEQISAFDIEFIRPRVDIEFSWGGNKSEKLFSPSGILEFASSGIPRVVESMFDAKEELDEKLREAINGFTFDESEEMMSMFRDELCKEGTISIEEMTAASKERARMVKRKLEEYISDSRTREILEGAIKTLVAEQLEMIKDRAKEANRQLWEDTRTLTEGLFE